MLSFTSDMLRLSGNPVNCEAVPLLNDPWADLHCFISGYRISTLSSRITYPMSRLLARSRSNEKLFSIHYKLTSDEKKGMPVIRQRKRRFRQWKAANVVKLNWLAHHLKRESEQFDIKTHRTFLERLTRFNYDYVGFHHSSTCNQNLDLVLINFIFLFKRKQSARSRIQHYLAVAKTTLCNTPESGIWLFAAALESRATKLTDADSHRVR